VAIADYWLHENQHLTGTSLMQAVDKQSWDSSVKALHPISDGPRQSVKESHLDFLVG
jgi:hypothetical protein